MLNIACIFEEASRATPHFNCLQVMPLPAAVYMMQLDVINHYRYALDHYFTLTLREPYLQNSSMGTPYQKWAFFANKDFDMLAVAAQNLMRYTSRLTNESECVALHKAERFSEMKGRGSTHIGALVELRDGRKAIGVRVNEDNSLSISALRAGPIAEHIVSRGSITGPGETVVVTTGADGKTHERVIGREEYIRLTEDVRTQKIAIGDRSILATLRERGHAEIAALVELNRIFGEATNTFYRSRNVAQPFSNCVPEWCI